jgi:hypothetical protein
MVVPNCPEYLSVQPAGLNTQCRSRLEERLHDLGEHGFTVHKSRTR